jgi:hypothetical protein
MKGLRRQAEAITSVFRYFHSIWKFGETIKSERLLVENYKYFTISVTSSQGEIQLY